MASPACTLIPEVVSRTRTTSSSWRLWRRRRSGRGTSPFIRRIRGANGTDRVSDAVCPDAELTTLSSTMNGPQRTLARGDGLMDDLLRLIDISKSFGEVQSLRQVSFRVGRNEIVGLVGDNGAGKSTLIKIITGYHQPTSGEILFSGQKINNLNVAKARQLG